MKKTILILLLIITAWTLSGCGEIALNKSVTSPIGAPKPKFSNGDIVRHKTLSNKQ